MKRKIINTIPAVPGTKRLYLSRDISAGLCDPLIEHVICWAVLECQYEGHASGKVGIKLEPITAFDMNLDVLGAALSEGEVAIMMPDGTVEADGGHYTSMNDWIDNMRAERAA